MLFRTASGATGFVGAHLLATMLARTAWRVCCVVRGDDGAARLARQLERHGARVAPDVLAERVEALAGDLARPKLGLHDAVWAAVTRGLRGIYHCGAEVHHWKRYDALRGSNVLGSVSCLQLACGAVGAAGGARGGEAALPLLLVSTLSVLSCEEHDRRARDDEESPLAGAALQHSGGYGQSKWAAEAALRHPAVPQGCVTVVRPVTMERNSSSVSSARSRGAWPANPFPLTAGARCAFQQ